MSAGIGLGSGYGLGWNIQEHEDVAVGGVVEGHADEHLRERSEEAQRRG